MTQQRRRRIIDDLTHPEDEMLLIVNNFSTQMDEHLNYYQRAPTVALILNDVTN